jgi:hypothetical protein
MACAEEVDRAIKERENLGSSEDEEADAGGGRLAGGAAVLSCRMLAEKGEKSVVGAI